jgi:hypothetical protein
MATLFCVLPAAFLCVLPLYIDSSFSLCSAEPKDDGGVTYNVVTLRIQITGIFKG